MRKTPFFVLLFLVCAVAAASAAGKRPLEPWNYYHFNGTAFTSGQTIDGSPFIAVREKLRPVLLTKQSSVIERTALPNGTGVIVGICYMSSTGGKSGGDAGFMPYPRIPLLVSTGGKPFVTVQTDDNGYFMAVLPAGSYTIGSGTFTTEIVVERGVTTLVPLRAGKRMAD